MKTYRLNYWRYNQVLDKEELITRITVGVPVRLYLKGDFLVHADIGGGWVISEATTGAKVAWGPSKLMAISNANKNLRKVGRIGFDARLKKMHRKIERHIRSKTLESTGG